RLRAPAAVRGRAALGTSARRDEPAAREERLPADLLYQPVGAEEPLEDPVLRAVVEGARLPLLRLVPLAQRAVHDDQLAGPPACLGQERGALVRHEMAVEVPGE